jgi:hypothetical protein
MSQKFLAPKDCSGASVLGVFYETDANGIVTIPDGVNSDIESHGFTPVAGDEKAAPAPSILDGKVADIVAALPEMDDTILAQLLADEQAGKNRKGVIDAITAQQAARAGA